MNRKTIVYILSLIVISASIFLLIEYPESNRMSLISGVLIVLGFSLNIGGFLMPKESN